MRTLQSGRGFKTTLWVMPFIAENTEVRRGASLTLAFESTWFQILIVKRIHKWFQLEPPLGFYESLLTLHYTEAYVEGAERGYFVTSDSVVGRCTRLLGG